MITQEELKAILHYCPLTGVFTRIIDRSNNAKKGGECGTVWVNHAGKKYRYIKLDGKSYRAHRLAFLYMTGVFPSGDVDHQDGNGLNNRWDNIKDVSSLANQQNKRLYSINKSGQSGVNWAEDRNKFRATIRVNTKLIHLGQFTDITDAIAARKAAELQYGFHANHGTDRPL